MATAMQANGGRTDQVVLSRTSRLVRERYAYTRSWAQFLVEPVEMIGSVMDQKMLGGIKDRAEQTA
jgi:hypothetical protein